MEYTLMVAGARAGKTGFVRMLLDTADIAPSATPEQLASLAAFVYGASASTPGIRTASVDVSVGDAVMRLNIVDTPALDVAAGSSGGAERVLADLSRFVTDKFSATLAGGSDAHVHLCIYLLDPDTIVCPPAPALISPPLSSPPSATAAAAAPVSRPTLLKAEVAAIQRLSTRVNVLPVVARADTLTSDRLAAVKLAVRRDLADAGIGFGIFDLDEAQPQDAAAPSFLRLPYALFTPDQYGHNDGVSRAVPLRGELLQNYAPTAGRGHSRLVLGKFTRAYRWGHADVLDHTHCDFLPLRHAIFHHRDTLQKYTRDYLFEKFVKELPPVPQPLPLATRPILTIDAPPLYPPQQPPAPSQPAPQQQQQQQQLPAQQPRAKKITIACNFCRSRKLKCDGARPACHQCLKRAHACDYQAPARSASVRKKRPAGAAAGSPAEDDDAHEREHSHDDEPGSADELENGGSASPAPSHAHEDAYEHSALPSAQQPAHHPYTFPPPHLHASAPPATMLAALGGGAVKSEPGLPALLEQHRRMPLLPPPQQLSLPHGGPPAPPPPSAQQGQQQHHALALQHVLHDPATALPPIRDRPPPPSQTSSEPGASASAGPGAGSGPSSGSTSPQQVRKRAATTGTGKARANAGYGPKVVACNHCRARKTKCDGQHPTCNSCARRSLACNYVNDPSQPSRRRATTSAAHAQSQSQSQNQNPAQVQAPPRPRAPGSPPASAPPHAHTHAQSGSPPLPPPSSSVSAPPSPGARVNGSGGMNGGPNGNANGNGNGNGYHHYHAHPHYAHANGHGHAMKRELELDAEPAPGSPDAKRMRLVGGIA